MLPKTSTAYAIPGFYMDADVFYSPAHLTFIIVYLTPWADSTFYYRYLKAGQAIRPSTGTSSDGSFSDYAENLVRYSWSEEKVLYKAQNTGGKYIYAGGVHLGYFGADDISNGGKKMLLSWTVPTGKEPGDVMSEYSHVTAHVELE
jgi:hypothetical protein